MALLYRARKCVHLMGLRGEVSASVAEEDICQVFSNVLNDLVHEEEVDVQYNVHFLRGYLQDPKVTLNPTIRLAWALAADCSAAWLTET